MIIDDLILSEDAINSICQSELNGLTYDEMINIHSEVSKEAAALIDDESATQLDRIIFASRFVYMQGFYKALTVMNDALKQYVEDGADQEPAADYRAHLEEKKK